MKGSILIIIHGQDLALDLDVVLDDHIITRTTLITRIILFILIILIILTTRIILVTVAGMTMTMIGILINYEKSLFPLK